MFLSRSRAFALALLAAAALVPARPLAAQLGYGPDKGLRVRVHAWNGDWLAEAGDGSDHAIGGLIGSDRPIDQITVTHSRAKIEVDAMIEGQWTGWKSGGAPSGKIGSKIEAVRMRVDVGSIRYRVAFTGIGLSDWAEDGAVAGRSFQNLSVESVEVLYRLDAKANDTFEYRAYFRGVAPTPWLQPGDVAETKAAKPELMGLEFRAGKGIRSEVAMTALGWLPTALEGEVAGRPGGRGRVEALRLFGGVSPMQYRVKVEGRGWLPWCFDGEECGAMGQSLRIEAVQVDIKRTGAKHPAPKG